MTNGALEDTAFVIVGNGIELDNFHFCSREWSAMAEGYVTIYWREAGTNDPKTVFSDIGAVRMNIDGQVLAEFHQLVCPDVALSENHAMAHANALRCLKLFIGDSPVFLYGDAQRKTYFSNIFSVSDTGKKYEVLDAHEVAFFTWMHLDNHSLENMAVHLHLPVAALSSKDYAYVVAKLLCVAREQAQELHRLLSTFPIFRIPKHFVATDTKLPRTDLD